MLSKVKKVLLVSPLVIVLSFLFFTGCMTFRQSDNKTNQAFEKHNKTNAINRFTFENRQVRVVESGEAENKDNLIVFVHGAPGSSRDMLPFLYDSVLLTKARMLSLDRLGYGYSNYGQAEVSIHKQAQVLAALVAEADESNIIVVGHSFGGPIVAKAAILSAKISSVVMLAPLNDPYNEKMFWIANLAKWNLTRWMLSKAWQVAAAEKFAHADELMKMKNDWKSLAVPVVHIHGHKDFLAPLSNVDWSENNIPSEHLKMINMEQLDHFIPFKNKSLVIEELLLLLK